MNLRLGLKMGLEEISAHRLRTVLTMLGIIFGVATFIALFSMLEGAIERDQMWLREEGGVELVSLVDHSPTKEQRLLARQGSSQGRTMGDARLLARAASLVAAVSPESETWSRLKRGSRETRQAIRLCGATAMALDIQNYQLEKGRFLCDLDQQYYRRVCVLGAKPAEELFGTENPIGGQVLVRGMPLEVVGVLKNKERMFGTWNALEMKNRVCFLPIATVLKRVQGHDRLPELHLRISPAEWIPWAVDQSRNLLKRSHGLEDFKFETREEWAANLERGKKIFSTVLGIIGGICLLSGGIGIMNVMLATVAQRTREIGIRRALGARRRDILAQFLIETLVLAVCGGLLGVALGVGMALALSLLPDQMAILRLGPILVAFMSALIVSLGFGLVPALNAAKLDPMEALRHD